MKHIFASLLDVAKVAIAVVVLGLGASTLSAQSTWIPAPANPPANNAPAPINVSNLPQRKFGPLLLGTTAFPSPSYTSLDVLGIASTTSFFSDFLVVSKGVTFAAGSPMKVLTFGATGLSLIDGTQGAGKVLTSDASGRATWQSLPAQACVGTPISPNTITLNLDSGNNNNRTKKLATLEPGTYTVTGSGTAIESGGDGSLGIILLSGDYPDFHNNSAYPSGFQSAVSLYGDPSIVPNRTIYGSGNPVIVGIRRAGSTGVNFSIPSGTTFTISQRSYIYLTLSQTNIQTGSITISGNLNNCTGATSVASTPVGSCDATPVRTITQSNSGTEYQNTSGTQLIVVATASETTFSGQNALAGYIGATSASTLVSQEIFTSTNRNSITFLVPPGYYYKVVNGATNSPTLNAQAWKVCGGSGSSVSTSGGSIANSGNLAIPNTDGTSVTWTHGLGEKPGFVRLVLVSLVDQSAAQGSYLAGEEIDVSNSVAVPSGGNYVSIPTLVTPTQVILPHQWASYPLHISANRVGAYNTGIAINRSTWAIKIYAGTSVGSSGGTASGGTGTTGSGMLGDYPDGIVCSATSGGGKIVLYAQGINVVSWPSPGRLVYSSDADVGGQHQSMYFNPSTGAYIGTDATSNSYSAPIASCNGKSLSQQVGFKFAGVNNVTATANSVTATQSIPSGTWCGSYNFSSSRGPLGITSTDIACNNSVDSCPSGYSKYEYVGQGTGTPANPRTGKLTCVKD